MEPAAMAEVPDCNVGGTLIHVQETTMLYLYARRMLPVLDVQRRSGSHSVCAVVPAVGTSKDQSIQTPTIPVTAWTWDVAASYHVVKI